MHWVQGAQWWWDTPAWPSFCSQASETDTQVHKPMWKSWSWNLPSRGVLKFHWPTQLVSVRTLGHVCIKHKPKGIVTKLKAEKSVNNGPIFPLGQTNQTIFLGHFKDECLSPSLFTINELGSAIQLRWNQTYLFIHFFFHTLFIVLGNPKIKMTTCSRFIIVWSQECPLGTTSISV